MRQKGQVGFSSPSTRRDKLRLTLPEDVQLIIALFVTISFIVTTSLTGSHLRKDRVHHGREPCQWRHEATSLHIHGPGHREYLGTGWSWDIALKAHFPHPGHHLPKDPLPPETEPLPRDQVFHSSTKLFLKDRCSSRAPVRKEPVEATGQSSSVISQGTLSHFMLLL